MRVCRHHNLVSELGGDCRWLRTRDEEIGIWNLEDSDVGLLSGTQRRGKATWPVTCECCGGRDWRGKDDVLQVSVQMATMFRVADDQRRGQ